MLAQEKTKFYFLKIAQTGLKPITVLVFPSPSITTRSALQVYITTPSSPQMYAAGDRTQASITVGKYSCHEPHPSPA